MWFRPPRSPTIVGSAVATIVWSRAASSITSTSPPKMTRTLRWAGGAARGSSVAARAQSYGALKSPQLGLKSSAGGPIQAPYVRPQYRAAPGHRDRRLRPPPEGPVSSPPRRAPPLPLTRGLGQREPIPDTDPLTPEDTERVLHELLADENKLAE